MTSSRLFYLGAALIFIYFGDSVYNTIFSNYLQDVHHASAGLRGFLEFPRELPGILSMFAAGLLFFLPDNKMGLVAGLIYFLGIITMTLPLASTSIYFLILIMVTASLGQHMLMVIVDAIVIHNSTPENRALRLGQTKALVNAAGLVGALYLWIKWKYFPGYISDFFVISAAIFIGSFFFLKSTDNKAAATPQKKSFKESIVMKKKYSRYYMLEIFFGARKQVFMTFAFWSMVAVFNEAPGYIGKLLLIAGILGVFFKPMVGKMIQKYGERKVLIFDSVIIVTICLFYAFSTHVFSAALAALVVSACFIIDNLMFATGAARSTFMARISEKPADITPSLYCGMALNHVVSIIAAVIGGIIWEATGTQLWVFLLTAGLAVISGYIASGIPDKEAPIKVESDPLLEKADAE